jgi:hypothetical protein
MHISAALTAGRADETRLDIAEPDLIGPAVAADRNRVAANDSRRNRSARRARHVAQLAECDFGGLLHAQ